MAPKVLGSVSIIYELGSIQHYIYGHWDIGKNRGDPPVLLSCKLAQSWDGNSDMAEESTDVWWGNFDVIAKVCTM